MLCAKKKKKIFDDSSLVFVWAYAIVIKAFSYVGGFAVNC